MRIVFVRHGEPDYANDCLTDAGKVQAAQAAQRLRSEGISEIWSSPFGRAMIGKTVGDIVEVEAPVGTVQFEILSVEK